MNLSKSIIGSTALHLTVLGILFLVEVPTDLESDTRVKTQLENQVDVKRLNLAKLLGRTGKKGAGDSDDKSTSSAGEDDAPETNPKSEKTASKTQRDRQTQSAASVESEKNPQPEQASSEEMNRTKKIAAKSTSPKSDSSEKKGVETKKTSEAAEEGESGDSKTAASKGPADGVAGAGGDGAGSAGTGNEGLSDGARADLIRGYSESIYRVVNREKTYPRLAKRMGQEGTVTVEIMVDSNGRILKVRVSDSSGSEILDEAARELFKSLDQLPAPPRKLAWTKKKLQIPLRYSLS